MIWWPTGISLPFTVSRECGVCSCATASGRLLSGSGYHIMQVNAHVRGVPSSRSRCSPAMQWTTLSLVAALATPAGHRAIAEGADSKAEKPPVVSLDASAHLRALTLPYSNFASPEAKLAYAQLFATDHHAPPADADIATRRAYFDRFNRSEE